MHIKQINERANHEKDITNTRITVRKRLCECGAFRHLSEQSVFIP
ncbi:hypothetical protein D046_7363A, partial [Vibrio parahaemolyticus V-223/04]